MQKKLFSYNVDISKNAYLNWRTSKEDVAKDLEVLAEGFATAALLLINKALEDNSDKKADIIIFPILYSIDQSVEVYLKAIIRMIETLNGGAVNSYTTHDIQSLLNTTLGMMKKREATTKGLSKHIEPLKKYIDELYALIKVKDQDGKETLNIDFARYPIDTVGEPHFYVKDSKNVVIDVENLLHRFEEIKDCLSSLCSYYENQLEGVCLCQD